MPSLKIIRSHAQTRLNTAAFTLIELLTVIAIIGILASILLPAIGQVRQTAKSTTNMSQLRQASLAILSFANETGKYPRLSDNSNDFPGSESEWYTIPSIRRALGDSSPNLDNNHSVNMALTSPAQEAAKSLSTDYHGVITHFSLAPAIGNHEQDGSPPLTIASVANPSQLILLADGGVLEGDAAGELYGACHPYMEGLSALANGDSRDLNPISFDMSGAAKMNFNRHGNGMTQVSFCDGHIESRAEDQFYYKNFVSGS